MECAVMSVLIDDRELAVAEMGIETVGQVLSHVSRSNRLITSMLIDGREADLDQLSVVKQSQVSGRTIYIETVEPRQMALDVISAIEAEFREAERLKNEATELLSRGETSKAIEKLGGCFTSWQQAYASVNQTAQLLRIDLDRLRFGTTSLAELAVKFSQQLREIKAALEARDYVLLSDVLTYEMGETTTLWIAALGAMRKTIT